jgi:[ribosomal protein S5]-alanine N-acetyltransferase
MATLTISTDRLYTRDIQPEDAPFILELVNTPGWIAFIGDRNVHSLSEATAYIDKLKQLYNLRYFALLEKESETPVGILSLIKRSYLPFHDIGFALLPEHMGKGFAYEGVSALLSVLRESNAYSEVMATVLNSNTRSIQLLVKLGLLFKEHMVHEGLQLSLYQTRWNAE